VARVAQASDFFSILHMYGIHQTQSQSPGPVYHNSSEPFQRQPTKAPCILLGVCLFCAFLLAAVPREVFAHVTETISPLAVKIQAVTPPLLPADRFVPHRSIGPNAQEAAALTAPTLVFGTVGTVGLFWFLLPISALGLWVAVIYFSNVLLPKPLPDVLLEFLKNRAIDRTLAVFQRGAGLEGWEDVDSHATIPRPELIGELKKFIRSYPYIVFFNVEGCGKSTAIRQACRKLDPAGGMVYFHVPLNQKDFAKELAAVLGMTSPNDWGLLSEVLNRPNDIAWDTLGQILESAAEKYKAQSSGNSRAVLIFDGVERLAAKEPMFFDALLYFSKQCFYHDSLGIIFVGTQYVSLPFIENGGSVGELARRLKTEHLDIPDADAIEYLVSRGAARPMAEKLVQSVTGGRLELLKEAAVMQNFLTYEEISDRFTAPMKHKLEALEVSPDNDLFRTLLDAPSKKMKRSEAWKILPWATILTLRRAGILTETARYEVTFHSRPVEIAIRELLSEQ